MHVEEDIQVACLVEFALHILEFVPQRVSKTLKARVEEGRAQKLEVLQQSGQETADFQITTEPLKARPSRFRVGTEVYQTQVRTVAAPPIPQQEVTEELPVLNNREVPDPRNLLEEVQ